MFDVENIMDELVFLQFYEFFSFFFRWWRKMWDLECSAVSFWSPWWRSTFATFIGVSNSEYANEKKKFHIEIATLNILFSVRLLVQRSYRTKSVLSHFSARIPAFHEVNLFFYELHVGFAFVIVRCCLDADVVMPANSLLDKIYFRHLAATNVCH